MATPVGGNDVPSGMRRQAAPVTDGASSRRRCGRAATANDDGCGQRCWFGRLHLELVLVSGEHGYSDFEMCCLIYNKGPKIHYKICRKKLQFEVAIHNQLDF
ncbi:unnamed protein product [Cuscuta epithymum]|uniref:Uncharacterized protein n=1 Tax=Cuscuta epithymum TaxID=186058 RepID=A0AAV0D9C4_9ASTE|nr:unnamed protein product [Cuscuta epithymum]